ncbi:DUF1661 domain-containing protein [Porphyromonas gingivalis]|nr:DUF1661 domain-containing protein [Porphyromonas gingivalis]MCE8193146.1 DUF1661 domain-containing protein [Porphyromonas gingivalis]PDP53211.1 DUF1661 domain-containing protein [Porphyromonas gingivalis]PDP66978.1 DUF1661 domain-containing protein [Porphyromonas gingivalis]RRG14408.1 DUF1661 domain-containing protein [Porphyromonas gingivalis]
MLLLKTRFVNFFILAWEAKNSHATTKKISRHFFREYAPQSEHFRFVFF